ncbi:thiamine-phosphate kinase [Pseudomonas viridiflava]|uniref:thiamine-phosphate kinase n=1 Tax=Pseudomonas viridiflava TaxID=33069 RepID=UPI000F03F253|nr:AIR synthase related protein [Pseudomonas viridiflava]
MEQPEITVGDVGELRLLKDFILPNVSSSALPGDDCAHLDIGNSSLLWSMDPCPTPVANWFGKATPEVWGCYTAAINLSDIASSGGKPLGMLVSLEMPDTTPVSFVQGFQRGLMKSLTNANARLFGGNVKSSSRFSATGTIIGTPVSRSITRSVSGTEFSVYLIGETGGFWTSVVANHLAWKSVPDALQRQLDRSLCFPIPQVEAGQRLSCLPFEVACMDCSDGAANAIYQLGVTNNLDVILERAIKWDLPSDFLSILKSQKISVENACFSFGDWQLACLVPKRHEAVFEEQLREFTVTYLGCAFSGSGKVEVDDGRRLLPERLNQNFQQGYNSIQSVDDLIDVFMRKPIFA